MPFRSKAQRRWMYANDPKMARKWSKHTPKGKRLPDKVDEFLYSQSHNFEDIPWSRKWAPDEEPDPAPNTADQLPRPVQGKPGFGASSGRAGSKAYPMARTVGSSREDDEDLAFAEQLLARYAGAGVVTDEAVLAAARMMGPTALAIAEAAVAIVAESVAQTPAVLFLDANAPGRAMAQLVRDLATKHRQLAVVLLPGAFSPAAAARMLMASLPDHEDGIEVWPGESPLAGLEAIIRDGRTDWIRSGHALTMYGPSDRLASLEQQLASGALPLDPTTIRMEPVDAPPDETPELRGARQDPEALKGLVDPQLAGDPRKLRTFASMLRTECLQREFLTDVAPSKGEAVKLLGDIVGKFWDLLQRRGIDPEGIKVLGAGNNGVAYQLRDGRVLKVTTDDAEAHVASHIKGKHFAHIFDIHDVWAFPGTYNGHHVYGLVTEAGLIKPSREEQDEFDWMADVLRTLEGRSKLDLESNLKGVLQFMMQDQRTNPADKRRLLGDVKRFNLPNMMADMRRAGFAMDFHGGNFMKRPDGTFVVIDIGTGGSDQEDAKPPFIEGHLGPHDRLDEVGVFAGPAAGSGAGAGGQLRGSNSSAWSGGKLSLAKPQNNVPEDENATHDDKSLDLDDRDGYYPDGYPPY